jgi:hypothetical protein
LINILRIRSDLQRERERERETEVQKVDRFKVKQGYGFN